MSNYITGDDMVTMLIGQGGSEAATYVLSDTSDDAVRARFAELVTDGEISAHTSRDGIIERILFMDSDYRALTDMGLIYDRGRTQDHYLTDAGAAFIAALLAEHGCRCSARTHRVMGLA